MEPEQLNIDLGDTTVYISGPMTGLDEYNFAAFDEAAAKHKEQGYTVINPAELSRNYAKQQGLTYEEICLREFAVLDCVPLIQKATIIHMLDGWEYSKGAKAEYAIAKWLGMQITYQSEQSLKAYNAYNKEWWFAFQAEQFRNICELTRKKNDDYTGGATTGNPFANFDESEEFGIDPLIGLSVRMGDKMQRLKAFCKEGLSLQSDGDTVADIFKDFIGYSVIALGMLERGEERD